MRSRFWVRVLMFTVLVVACGTKLMDGWNESVVAEEKKACIAKGATEKYCNCYVDKSSVTLTYSAFKNAKVGDSSFDTLQKIDAECSK